MTKTSPIKGLFDVGWFDHGRMAVVSRITAIRPLSHLSLPDTEQRIAICQLVQMLPRTSRYYTTAGDRTQNPAELQ